MEGHSLPHSFFGKCFTKLNRTHMHTHTPPPPPHLLCGGGTVLRALQIIHLMFITTWELFFSFTDEQSEAQRG